MYFSMLKRIKTTGFTIIICSFVIMFFAATSCSSTRKSQKCNCPAWSYELNEKDSHFEHLTKIQIESESDLI
jgi:hypothetical protein